MMDRRIGSIRGGAGTLFLLIIAATLCAQSAPKAQTAQQVLGSAYRARDQKKWDEALKACEQVIAMAGAEAPQKIEAFNTMVDVYRRQKDWEKAMTAAVRLGAEIKDSNEAVVRSAMLQGELLQEKGRKAEALAQFAAAAEKATDLRSKQGNYFRVAAINSAEGHHEEAIAAYEKVFTTGSGFTDHWAESQRGIVESLRKLNRPAEALAAARIIFNAAGDAGQISNAAQLVAQLFKEADKNISRANAFLEYQQFGPAGKDGKAGTADDLTNPLETVAYPPYAAREEAFKKMRESAGGDAPSSKLRALTYVYTGHPAEALQEYAEYFRRSHGEPYLMLAVVQEMIDVGVRGVRGHAVGLERFWEFVRVGPSGADAQAGTADDLKDPFEEIGLKSRAPGDENGSLAAADRKALTDLRGVLEKLALAERDDVQFRQWVLGDLDRVHNALMDWGSKGQVDWYLKVLADTVENEYVGAAVLTGGEAAARGTDLHYGNVRAFWTKAAAAYPVRNGKFPEQMEGLRGRLGSTQQLLEKPPSVAPVLPPLK